MNLVTYSDSEDDTIETNKGFTNIEIKPPPTQAINSKRKRTNEDDSSHPGKPPLPPLPSTFTTLYTTSARYSTTDDPTLHSGRKRQIPHIEGNWPSFVYLEWVPSPSDLVSLEDVVSRIGQEYADSGDFHDSDSNSNGEVRSSLRSDLGVRLPLHLSLSAPLILTTTNKDQFQETLTRSINDSNIATFSTTPSSIEWVKNFDSTRHFLILTLSRPKQDELQGLLSSCNRTANTFRLSQLYARGTNTDTDSTTVGIATTPAVDATGTNSSYTTPNHDNFHISIAWSLNQVTTSQTLLDQMRERLKHMTISFGRVYIKIGNHVSSVPLRDAPSIPPSVPTPSTPQ